MKFFFLGSCFIPRGLLRSSNNYPQSGDFRRELLILAAPAILGQAIDPLAQLMETAYIGSLGIVSPISLCSHRMLLFREKLFLILRRQYFIIGT